MTGRARRLAHLTALSGCLLAAGCSSDDDDDDDDDVVVIDAASPVDAPAPDAVPIPDAPPPDATPPPDAPPSFALEIGTRGAGDTFVPLVSGQEVTVVLGPSGLYMFVLSLRMNDVAAGDVEPLVRVLLSGTLYAIDAAAFMTPAPVGDDYVLWDIYVPFMELLCCFNCADVTIEAEVTDSAADLFAGSVTVRPALLSCPDPSVCCATGDACPLPSEATICE